MKVEAPFIHLIKLHTKYYLYDVNSKMIVNISNDLFDFFKSNENIKAEIEIPHKLEDEVRRLLKYDLFSKTDTGYEIEYPQGTNLEEILNNCMRIMTLQVMILSILVDTFISKISFPMQPGPEIGSISDA